MTGPGYGPLDAILALIVKLSRVDLLHYKHTTLSRRVSKRLTTLGIGELESYYQYLLQEPKEQHLLYKEMLVHVSSFFRDHKSFDTLCAQVFSGFPAATWQK